MRKIFLLACFLCLFVFSTACAILAPQVYLDDLLINNNVYTAGAVIDGTVSIQNYEESYASNLLLKFYLLSKEVDGVPTQIIDKQISSEPFSLFPGGKITKTLSYILPVNLPGGSAIFRVQLVNDRGEEISWVDQPIMIGAAGSFLELTSAWIVKDGKNFSPGGGVYYEAGEIARAKFDVNNNSNSAIIAFPRIVTYKRNSGADIAAQADLDGVIIGPKIKRTIDFQLPAITEPETYFSEVKFYDSQTKLPISNSVFYRWIISGVNAKVLYANIDKENYQPGEIAQVGIKMAGPANSDLDGGAATVKTQIISRDGNVLGVAEKEIVLGSNDLIMDVVLDDGTDNFKVASQIKEGGRQLDQYVFWLDRQEKIPVNSDAHSDDISQTKNLSDESLQFLVAIIAILIAIVLGIVFFIRRKPITK